MWWLPYGYQLFISLKHCLLLFNTKREDFLQSSCSWISDDCIFWQAILVHFVAMNGEFEHVSIISIKIIYVSVLSY